MTSRAVTKASRKKGGKTAQGNRRHIEKYAGDAYDLAISTAKGLQAIRKLINIETKVLDTVNGATIPNTGTVSTVSSIAQGLDYTNRVGDSIKIQYMEFKFRWTIGASATNSFVRVMVVRDLDGYGSTPALTDILATANVLSPINYLHKDRFSVLFDEVEVLTSANNTSSVGAYLTPHAGHIKYLGTSSSTASNGKGSVYMVFLGSEATNVPRVDFYSRIAFTDD